MKYKLLIAFFLTLSIFFNSCDKTEYVKRSDIESENGFVKGTVKGVYKDGIKIDESFNLTYSALDGNIFSVYDDYTSFRVYNQSSLIGNGNYSCSIVIEIIRNMTGNELGTVSVFLHKELTGNRIVDLHMYDYKNLEMLNFKFDENTKKVSGEIMGTINCIYSDEETGNLLEEPFDLELDFNVTVYELI